MTQPCTNFDFERALPILRQSCQIVTAAPVDVPRKRESICVLSIDVEHWLLVGSRYKASNQQRGSMDSRERE